MKRYLSATVFLMFILTSVFAVNDSINNDPKPYPAVTVDDPGDYVFASKEDIQKAITVVVDSAAAVLTTNYGNTAIELPSIAITAQDSGLPSRITFFLADPNSFTREISKHMGAENTNFFSNIISSFSKAVSDPLLGAVYYGLSSRHYEPGDYLISGSVVFSFPEGYEGLNVSEIIYSGITENNPVKVSTNLNLFGLQLEQPVKVVGDFLVSVENKSKLVIKSIGEYRINDTVYENGVFVF